MFAERLFGSYTEAMLTLMIDLANRTGLFEAVANGPGTSAELADRAGLTERYARECLGALATGGIVGYDASTATYSLPPEHAACLVGAGSGNLAPFSRIVALLARHVPEVERAFREGGGVPYERYRPEFTDVMDGMSRGFFDGQLLAGVLPLTGGLADRLAAGARVADVGCGTGHSTNLLAKAFPASTFVGYDINDEAIDRARLEALELGLGNVRFEVLDVAHLPSGQLDAVFAFDAIHDQVAPAEVLDRIHAALAPGGVLAMLDIRASSDLARNLENPLAPFLYAISTLHCMTVSLAYDGAGLGAVWGEELAVEMLEGAGFVDIQVHEVPEDPIDSLYVAHKP